MPGFRLTLGQVGVVDMLKSSPSRDDGRLLPGGGSLVMPLLVPLPRLSPLEFDVVLAVGEDAPLAAGEIGLAL